MIMELSVRKENIDKLYKKMIVIGILYLNTKIKAIFVDLLK